jgi:ribosomal protein L23
MRMNSFIIDSPFVWESHGTYTHSKYVCNAAKNILKNQIDNFTEQLFNATKEDCIVSVNTVSQYKKNHSISNLK